MIPPAQRRRRELEEESAFFGSMDGASKFVRGDAVAGLLILFINLIGGIAIGVVQGLAFALDRPVLPVSNLAVLAQRALREQGATQVAAAIDARMDEVYWGCYREHGGEMQLVGSEAVLPPEQVVLPRAAGGDWFGAGTGWGYAERMPVAVQGCDAALLPHAEDLLRLAAFAWQRGEALEADQAQPVYLRDNVATPKGIK